MRTNTLMIEEYTNNSSTEHLHAMRTNIRIGSRDHVESLSA